MSKSVDKDYIIATILGILDITYADKTKDAKVIRCKLKHLIKELKEEPNIMD